VEPRRPPQIEYQLLPSGPARRVHGRRVRKTGRLGGLYSAVMTQHGRGSPLRGPTVWRGPRSGTAQRTAASHRSPAADQAESDTETPFGAESSSPTADAAAGAGRFRFQISRRTAPACEKKPRGQGSRMAPEALGRGQDLRRPGGVARVLGMTDVDVVGRSTGSLGHGRHPRLRTVPSAGGG